MKVRELVFMRGEGTQANLGNPMVDGTFHVQEYIKGDYESATVIHREYTTEANKRTTYDRLAHEYLTPKGWESV